MCEYKIRLTGLKEKLHQQDFEINNQFFEQFEHSEVTRGDFIVSTSLLFREAERSLKIDIKGSVKNLYCDICNAPLEIQISSIMDFLIQTESIREERGVNEDIIYVAPYQYELSIKQIIYEMINLAIPKSRTHSIDKRNNIKCDQEMLLLLNKYTKNKKDVIDPRWEILKEFK